LTTDAFCMACGAALPDGAQFCPSCGAGQTPEALATLSTPVGGEFCEVSRREESWAKWVFSARAVGPSGFYETAHSTFFQHDPVEKWTDKHEEALDGLIRELTAAGWTPVGKGDLWFQYQFRREAR
jgi:hypothetical protein